MKNRDVSGGAGYRENAAMLIERYETLDFERLHGPSRRFFPPPPARILDIGAGTGRDAAVFAAMGYAVVAVEPVAAFMEAGKALHPSANIRWINGALPALEALREERDREIAPFNLIMATASWMHQPRIDRRRAMKRVAGLLADAGVLIMLVRHGPVPAGRRMFQVTPGEIITSARVNGLHLAMHRHERSLQERNQRAGVTWSRLAFKKPTTQSIS